jgi:predicted nucleic acid-binding protein/predicted nucleotidyltransferase
VVELVITDEFEAEYRRAVEDPQVRRYAAKVDRQKFVDAIVGAAERVEASSAAGAVPADPGDDKVVAAALAGSAAFIVTLDHHLLELGWPTGVLFLRPGDFLRELRRQHMPRDAFTEPAAAAYVEATCSGRRATLGAMAETPYRVSDPTLAELLRRLVPAYLPERVYLFGSRARGEAGPDSDYDLLLVVPDDASADRRRSRLAYEVLRGTGVAADVLVCTRSWFDRREGLKASLPGTVLREGRLLHAA